jgi:hypothetical protein
MAGGYVKLKGNLSYGKFGKTGTGNTQTHLKQRRSNPVVVGAKGRIHCW